MGEELEQDFYPLEFSLRVKQMEKCLELLAPYAPVIQTTLWIIFIIALLTIFHEQCIQLFTAMRKRIEGGCSFKAGPIELGADLDVLKKVNPESHRDTEEVIGSDWDSERRGIYENNRGVFLTHVITPSRKAGQKYDIYIYLIRHKTNDFNDIEKAELFFGHMWGNQIFNAYEESGLIGVTTSAYEPFLCTCCVYFKDGKVIRLNRYVDFEMGRIFEGK